MGKINILNNAGDAKASLEFNGSSDIEVNADNLSGITSDVQGQIDSKVDKISSTDNAIARFDGTTGQLQDSGVTIDDNGNVGIGTTNVYSTVPLTMQSSVGQDGSGIAFKDNTGNFSGAIGTVDIAGRYITSSSIGDLCIRSEEDIIFSASGSDEKMRIDSAGIVTMPYQPAFYAYFTTDQQIGTGKIITYNATRSNIGNHMNISTGLFTAPVAGTYHFSFNTVIRSISNYLYGEFRVNGSGVEVDLHTGNNTNDYNQRTVSMTYYLNAGDTVGMWLDSSTDNDIYLQTNRTAFSGHLIG